MKRRVLVLSGLVLVICLASLAILADPARAAIVTNPFDPSSTEQAVAAEPSFFTVLFWQNIVAAALGALLGAFFGYRGAVLLERRSRQKEYRELYQLIHSLKGEQI